MHTRTCALLCLLLLGAASTAASERLVVEIIALNHRSATELTAVLRPLVPPPGSVSAFQGQLVVKTTRANLAELRRVLAELDRAPRTLLVSVRRGLAETARGREDEAAVRIEHGDATATIGAGRGAEADLGAGVDDDDARVRLRASAAETRSDDAALQRVRVLEGQEAFIQVGRSVPSTSREIITSGGAARVRESVEFRDVTRGFYVTATVHGDRVALDISPHSARLDPGGNVDVQAAATTVSGRLGQWIPIGGVDERSRRSESGLLHRAESARSARHTLYVKVETLDR